ncbi:MAG: zeta toxin family protein [Eggerthellaceae bacterium]|nr:zeta toxin family protein [Eggerthellaceae bacterium]
MAKIEEYTLQQFQAAFSEIAKKLLVNPALAPSKRERHAFLLGGQSGAGKTTLHKVLYEELAHNVIVINGDEYRRAHPNFQQIQQRYGVDAPAHTARWSGQMTEALIDAFSDQGYNLVVEGTLRTSNVPLRTAALLRERGYSAGLAIMAVKPEISLISCQIRYELMRLAGTTPRATDPTHHDKIVHDIVDNMAVLENSGAFDDIRVFNRAAECLFPAKGAASASEVLATTLFGPWSLEEHDHYAHLQSKLQSLQVG